MTALRKVFGEVNMTWPKVIIFAIICAVIDAVFAIVPFFQNTSFHNMNVCFEAWVIITMFIVLNTKKPLEAALKTVVFFFISQPLIYLLQVPFSELGFGIFRFYPYWLIWTVLTFPGAFVAWYVKKKNWLSVIILSLINIMLLGFEFPKHLDELTKVFPEQIIACIFIILEVIVLILVCLDNKMKRLITSGIAVVICAVFLIFTTNIFIVHGTDGSVMYAENTPYTIVSTSEGIEATTDGTTINFTVTEYGKYKIVVKGADGKKEKIIVTYDENGIETSDK